MVKIFKYTVYLVEFGRSYVNSGVCYVDYPAWIV